MSRRSNATGVVVVFAGALAILDVVDVPFYVALLLAAVGYSGARAGVERLRNALRVETGSDGRDEPVAAKQARREYVDGEIDEDELEARLERAFDPDVRAIREQVGDDVDGVGYVLSARLADVFGTVDAVMRADRDELEQVDGVGPAKAEKITALERPDE